MKAIGNRIVVLQYEALDCKYVLIVDSRRARLAKAALGAQTHLQEGEDSAETSLRVNAGDINVLSNFVAISGVTLVYL